MEHIVTKQKRQGKTCLWRSLLVNVSTVAYGHNFNNKYLVKNRINNSKIANTQSKVVVLPCHRLNITNIGQFVNRIQNSAARLISLLFKEFDRRFFEIKTIYHSNVIPHLEARE